jgi:multiple sugar transport system substrate-binding protein
VRTRLITALAACAVLALAGCGGDDEPEGGDNAASGGDTGETITMWTRAATQTQSERLVKAYNDSHENQVELTVIPTDNYQARVAAAAGGKNLPDVFASDVIYAPNYTSQGLYLDITDRIDELDFADALAPAHMRLGTYEDAKYTVPHTLDLSVLFWNKKLFKEAGLDGPPATLDDFVEYSKKISAIPGKYGYCLRGGPGAFNGMHMFMNIAQGKGGYFTEDGTSTMNEEGSVKGLQMLADMYKDGLAPKDAVSWGFNETVTGFYSGTCAMLNQDPDALLGIAEKMSPEDFAVAPMPVGPSGKSYPTLGYAGWAMFADSDVKEDSWKLMEFLLSPKANLEWAKIVGVLPIHDGADQDASFKTEQFKGWFEELNDPSKYEMVTPPTHLENLGNFVDQVAIKNFQEVLLGQKDAKTVADEWAEFLTKEQQAWMAANKK